MRIISNKVHLRVIACVIPIALAIVLGCGVVAKTVTSPAPAGLKPVITIGATTYRPQPPRTTHVEVMFVGPIFALGVSLTCNHITLRPNRPTALYEPDVP